MKVLSWDVGIINLAYCLIDYNKETKKFIILDWNIINLTDRDKIKCSICNNNPSSYQAVNNLYYCKVHSKHVEIVIPEFKLLFNDVSPEISETCYYEGKTKCTKKSKYTYNNTYYCNVHSKSIFNSITNSYKLVNYTKKGIDSMSMDAFRLRLIQELEKRPNLLNCDIVFIENQPSLKNPRMKTISGTVYDYYMIRGMIDKNITKSPISAVHFMSPSNKLKLANDGDRTELVKVKNNEEDSKTYKLTKSLGIKYCLEMIKDFPEWVTHFNSYKKKDDLADCFLQGMYALLCK